MQSVGSAMAMLLLLLLATEQVAIYGVGSSRPTPPDTTADNGRRRPHRPEAANGLTSVISRDASVRANVVNSVRRSASRRHQCSPVVFAY